MGEVVGVEQARLETKPDIVSLNRKVSSGA